MVPSIGKIWLLSGGVRAISVLPAAWGLVGRILQEFAGRAEYMEGSHATG